MYLLVYIKKITHLIGVVVPHNHQQLMQLPPLLLPLCGGQALHPQDQVPHGKGVVLADLEPNAPDYGDHLVQLRGGIFIPFIFTNNNLQSL